MNELQISLFFFGGGAFGLMMIVRLAIKMSRLHGDVMRMEFERRARVAIDYNVSPFYGFSKGGEIGINEGDDEDLVYKKQEFIRQKERCLRIVVRWYIVAVIGAFIGVGVGAMIYGAPN
jgi:hypothetical protein